MHNLAQNIEDIPLHQTLATIANIEPALVVQTSTARFEAQLAVSCLVAPEVGDRVMLATAENGDAWVLAVLNRDSDDVTLHAKGDLHIEPGGRFRVSAKRGIDLVTGAMSLLAGKLEVRSVDAEVTAERLGFVGRVLESEVHRIKSFAHTCDTVMDRFSQTVDRSFRRVTGRDELRAGRIDHEASGTMNLRGKDTVMTAERFVKVDAEQIQMG